MARRYHIDLNWLRENRRSFTSLGSSRLCEMGHDELKRLADDPDKTGEILEAIQECCGQQENFVSATQPIMESLFRLFLATGNRPMTVEEIGQELESRRGGRAPQPQVIELLLEKDTFYGVRPLPDSASE